MSLRREGQPNTNKTTKEDAMELAILLYDMFKANKVSGKVVIGQNNAQQFSSE